MIYQYSKQEISDYKKAWPKGCKPPQGYIAMHNWALAQNFHGLKQTQCKDCGLWFFPQEDHKCRLNTV